MSSHDPATVHAVFAAVCDLADAERTAALAKLCGDDAALRREVESLLAHADTPGALDETSLGRVQRALHDTPPPATPEVLPTSLGEFRIEGLLGRGGMGVVYRARQPRPDREIALKVLAPAPSADAERRFAFEAETLARLRHPGIAQVFATGTFTTDAGPRPYLAMELVEGLDLRRYCEAANCTIAARIGLLLQICEAVHHAHQKGVVHRDLKPANVLVDDDGRVKVLDFGIARLVAERDAGPTMTGQVLGTLAYMSPEQADGRVEQVDTRADVYALGVIGYELLTGALPIAIGADPLTRAIRRLVEEPPTPLGQRDPSLRGDLQTILHKCLQKAPDDRYSSAMALAEDLRRHLRHEPVLARAPSRLYVLARFARRHRLLLALAATTFVSLGVGLAVSVAATNDAHAALRRESAALDQAVEARTLAETEAERARRQLAIRDAVLRFLDDACAEANPMLNPGARDLSGGELFADAAAQIGREFADRPEAEKELRLAFGKLLLGLGEVSAARQHLERAFELPADPDAPLSHATAGVHLALALERSGEPTAALPVMERAAAYVAQLQGDGGLPEQDLVQLRLAVLMAHGQVHFECGEHAEAERMWRMILDEVERHPEYGATTTAAHAGMSLASILVLDGRLDEAEQLVRRGLGGLSSRFGPAHAETLLALNNLAGVRFRQGDFAGAAAIMRDVVNRLEQVLGPEHEQLFTPTQNLASVEWRLGRHDEALARMRKLLAATADAPHDVEAHAGAMANLGNMLWKKGELDEAATWYQRAVDLRLRTSPAADLPLSGFYNDLARIRLQQDRPTDHLELLRESVRIRIEAVGPLHERVLPRRVELAAAELHFAGDVDAALAHLLAVDALLMPELGPEHRATVLSQQLLAECLLQKGDRDGARTYIDRLAERGARHQHAATWAEAVQRLRAQLDGQ